MQNQLIGDFDFQGKKSLLELEEGATFIVYLKAKEKINLTQTEVPKSL